MTPERTPLAGPLRFVEPTSDGGKKEAPRIAGPLRHRLLIFDERVVEPTYARRTAAVANRLHRHSPRRLPTKTIISRQGRRRNQALPGGPVAGRDGGYYF